MESLPKMLMQSARRTISTARGIREMSVGESLPFMGRYR
jgi:hypothetical protein